MAGESCALFIVFRIKGLSCVSHTLEKQRVALADRPARARQRREGITAIPTWVHRRQSYRRHLLWGEHRTTRGSTWWRVCLQARNAAQAQTHDAANARVVTDYGRAGQSLRSTSAARTMNNRAGSCPSSPISTDSVSVLVSMTMAALPRYELYLLVFALRPFPSAAAWNSLCCIGHTGRALQVLEDVRAN